MYLIVNCTSCGKLLIANSINKTKACPHCGFKIKLFGTKIIARTESSYHAVELIQKLKEAKKGKNGNPVFKTFKR
mgnify:CR=1 FL=1